MYKCFPSCTPSLFPHTHTCTPRFMTTLEKASCPAQCYAHVHHQGCVATNCVLIMQSQKGIPNQRIVLFSFSPFFPKFTSLHHSLSLPFCVVISEFDLKNKKNWWQCVALFCSFYQTRLSLADRNRIGLLQLYVVNKTDVNFNLIGGTCLLICLHKY